MFKYVCITFWYLFLELKCLFDSYSDYKLNHRSIVKKNFTSANNYVRKKWLGYEFFTKSFFPKLELLNSGCGLSASAAYTPVFTVLNFAIKILVLQFLRWINQCNVIHSWKKRPNKYSINWPVVPISFNWVVPQPARMTVILETWFLTTEERTRGNTANVTHGVL